MWTKLYRKEEDEHSEVKNFETNSNGFLIFANFVKIDIFRKNGERSVVKIDPVLIFIQVAASVFFKKRKR